MAQPDAVMIEVRVTMEHDPPIPIYHTEVRNDTGVWFETFGSRERLQSFLLGLKTLLYMTGYHHTQLEWSQPESWDLPSGRRWTIPLLGKGNPKIEDLDHDGAVMHGV